MNSLTPEQKAFLVLLDRVQEAGWPQCAPELDRGSVTSVGKCALSLPDGERLLTAAGLKMKKSPHKADDWMLDDWPYADVGGGPSSGWMTWAHDRINAVLCAVDPTDQELT